MALNGASLRAYDGEVHAIIGGNGSGKSTLAKVISGVLIPDSGQVSIFGKSASSPVEAKALGIANVYQEVLVTDECSVLDNLYIGADNLFSATIGPEEKVAKASALMGELLGFDLDLATLVGDLPLSIKQWITIARALLTDPKILILDESSAALDFDSTERLFQKMRELKEQGASILMVSHRIAELVRIADRATVLRDGVDVGSLQREEITEAVIFELIAGPDEVVVRHLAPALHHRRSGVRAEQAAAATAQRHRKHKHEREAGNCGPGGAQCQPCWAKLPGPVLQPRNVLSRLVEPIVDHVNLWIDRTMPEWLPADRPADRRTDRTVM